MNQYREKYEGIMEYCAQNLQGFYGRFFYDRYMPADEEVKDSVCQKFADAGIENVMDFIMYIEG